MSENPFPEPDEIRTHVLNVLLLFRHADRLPSIQPLLPPGRIAFELCRTWFNRVYTPGLRYMEGIKGDFDPEKSAAFVQAFSDEEFSWIERFNRFLELRVDRLTREQKANQEFPDGDTWRAIRRDAGNILDLMNAHSPSTGGRFERAVRELTPFL